MPAPNPPALQPRRNDVVGDIWGGFAAMLVALPSAIAYGVAIYGVLGADYVGFGVRAGLLGAIAIGLVTSALGGAPRLISAPCAPAAAVLSALVAELATGGPGASGPVSPGRIVVLLTLVALLAGCLQALYGAVGGGRLIKYIPYPVVSGYLSGVAVLIFVSQVPKFFSWPKDVAFWSGLASPGLWQWPAVVVGTVTVAGVLLGPRLTRAVPATILGLLAGIVVYFGLGLIRPELLHLDHNKLVIGPVGGGMGAVIAAFGERWTAVAAVRFADLAALVVPALTLSVLLSIDTLKTCVVVDALTRSRHNSNRELIGQGAGNFASALIGGMPGSGTMGATLVNVNSGGRTRLSGLMEGVFVLAAFVLFGNWIAWVPISALAGILFVVAFRMFDWSIFHLLRQRSTMLDFCVIAAVVVVAVGVDLIAASGTGLALAILLFIREQIRGSVIRRKVTGDKISSTQHRSPEEQAVLQQQGGLTTVCELQGSLFFGTTDRLFTDLEPDLKRCRYLILDMRRVHSVDYTAVHLLEQFEAILHDNGGDLIFSRLPAILPTGQDLRTYFAQVGVTQKKENVRRFDTLDDALRWVEDQILAEHLPRQETGEAPLVLSQFELLQDVETAGMLAFLARCVVERSCVPGELVFQAGGDADELYLIRRGIVRIVMPVANGSYHNLASIGRGDFFGEVAFLDRGRRSANAVATTPVDLFVISRANFDEVSRNQPAIAARMLGRLARTLALRLRHADTELRAWYEA
jgi:SulP family sulfate permease